MVYGSNVKTSPSCLTRVIKYNFINETITNNIKFVINLLLFRRAKPVFFFFNFSDLALSLAVLASTTPDPNID